MVKMWQLQSSCCCCTLKTGTIIIGILGIIGGFLMIASALGANTYEDQSLELLDSLGAYGDKEHDRTFSVIVKIIMAFIEIIMSSVLIFGAVKCRPKWVYPWIVLNVVQNALSIIVIFSMAIYVMAIGKVEVGFILLVSLMLYSCVAGYMILVVNSFHTTILSPPSYEYTMTKEPVMCA